MHRITPNQPHPLFDSAATRRIERAAAAGLPAQALMQRAGLAAARLALALAPHARLVWIACGPGNNGGDGLEAAVQLRRAGRQVLVTWLGRPDRAPADARAAWLCAQAAGLQWADGAIDAERLGACDLCVDALLGLGISSTSAACAAAARVPDARLLACLHALRHSHAPVLALDLPSGLDADTGQFAAGLAPGGNGNDSHDDGDGEAPAPAVFPRAETDSQRTEPAQSPASGSSVQAALPRRWRPLDETHQACFIPAPARHTLSLLSLKPGLFTAAGRDAAGQVWFDDLGIRPGPGEAPSAWLSGPPASAPRAHASHKGSYGDVAVVGGEGLAARGMGMCGAALLAASAALHAGAGRVLVALLDAGAMQCAAQQPELMLRRFDALALERLTVVCGCGGGAAVAGLLPEVIARAARLVLDADALNHIAACSALQALLAARGRQGRPTVLTPHPLEAARLLGLSVARVQADRLAAARQLTARLHCVTVLKGSGSVIAAPGQAPAINPTGNARLATAGSGDVLAGMLAARLAAGAGAGALRAASEAVYAHGLIADRWPAGPALTAGALARRAGH